MEISLMVEGQEGVTWEQWRALAAACEEEGLAGLFRSDHYVSVMGQTSNRTTDAWALLSGLAAVTERIRLGTLVSPATFRHPSVLAAMVMTAEQISGGRIEVGMGAGWHGDEHAAYGFEFPDTGARFDRLEEQVEIVRGFTAGDAVSFAGQHYRLDDATTLPAPVQPRVPVIIGGLGGPRSAALAAAFADEYNTVGFAVDDVAACRDGVAAAWEEAGRDDLTFSVMTACVVATDGDELRARARRVMAAAGEDGDPGAYLEEHRDSWIVGTVPQVRERLGRLSEAGVDRVMLQLRDHRDLEMVALLGEDIVGAV